MCDRAQASPREILAPSKTPARIPRLTRRRDSLSLMVLVCLLGVALSADLRAACPPGVSREVIYEPVRLFGGVGAGLAIDADDNVYVAENTGVFVTRVTPGGAASNFVPAGTVCSLTDIEFDNAGNLLLADGVANGATGNPSCNRVVSVAPDGTATTLITGIANPGGIGVDSTGDIYVSSWDDNTVSRYAPDGTFIGIVGSGFSHLPLDVEVDADDNVYVAAFQSPGFSAGTRIYRITPGGVQTVWADPGIIDPHSLAVAADGTVWATYYNGTRLLQFDTDGTLLQNLPGGGSGGPDADNGIAINSDGDVHVMVNGGRTTRSSAVVKLCGLAAPPAGPQAVCRDATVQLDAAGNGTVTPDDVDGGSTSPAGIASRTVTPNTFTCANVGPNLVTLTITDTNGNVDTCTATVTVVDSVAPSALCRNITVNLDAAGNASISAADVDDGSNDACGISSRTVSPNTFTCADVGGNVVTLTVQDSNGNTSSCNATVTVVDSVAPQALCRSITVNLDAAGNASITAADVDDGSNDACGIASRTVSPSTFTCANVGANTVTLTVRDENGNTSSCDTTVTVVDSIAPQALCKGITVQLDDSGNATIGPDDVDDGSNDACGVATRTVSPSSFSCADVGSHVVTLTVQDTNGNTSTCTSTVVVEDNVAPEALCQPLTVQLDASGNASIGPDDLDDGSNDACGIASRSVSPNSFTCDDVGANTVTLTIEDSNGNSSTCTATVMVEDSVAPMALCRNLTVQLDSDGNASITPSDVDAGSNDACGVASLSVAPDSFTCADLGSNLVTLTVTDSNGNSSDCTSEVFVEDLEAPMALAILAPFAPALPLDATSACSAPTSRMFTVECDSADNCGVTSLTADLVVTQYAFDEFGDCEELTTLVPVECGETVELRLAAAPCPARAPRSAADPVSVNSDGNLLVTAEHVDLEVVATDSSGNSTTDTFDPTVDVALPCAFDDLLEDGTCCPAIAAPKARRCQVPVCGDDGVTTIRSSRRGI